MILRNIDKYQEYFRARFNRDLRQELYGKFYSREGLTVHWIDQHVVCKMWDFESVEQMHGLNSLDKIIP